jgi:hypothetical protein
MMTLMKINVATNTLEDFLAIEPATSGRRQNRD